MPNQLHQQIQQGASSPRQGLMVFNNDEFIDLVYECLATHGAGDDMNIARKFREALNQRDAANAEGENHEAKI